MFAMHYDERHGDIEGARGRYKMVLGELSPRLLSATVAAANFEKRRVRVSAVYSGTICVMLSPSVCFLAPPLSFTHFPAMSCIFLQGNREDACQLFEVLLKEERAKDDEASKSTLPFIAMHYANFLRTVYKDVAKGRAGGCCRQHYEIMGHPPSLPFLGHFPPAPSSFSPP